MTYYTPPEVARQLERDFDIVLANPPFTPAAPTAPGKTLPALRLLRTLWRNVFRREVQP